MGWHVFVFSVLREGLTFYHGRTLMRTSGDTYLIFNVSRTVIGCCSW